MSIRHVSPLKRTSGKSIGYYNLNSFPNSEEYNKLFNSLKVYKDLCYGKIYQDKDNDFWYINPKQTETTLISEDRVNLLLEWDKLKLLPNETLFNKLVKIGGLASSKYSFNGKYLDFPCMVKVNNDEWIDFCIVRFSETPPVHDHLKKIILFDDLLDIRPSEYALSHSLRLASTLASEIRMSFYPFTLKTKGNELLTYNRTTHFVSDGDIKGDEIICEVPFDYDTFKKIKDNGSNNYTYVIGKWNGKMDKLFKEYEKRLEAMITPNKLILSTNKLYTTKASITLFFWEWVNRILNKFS
jgi:hypothetical protein